MGRTPDEANEETSLLPQPVASENTQAATEQNDTLDSSSNEKPALSTLRGVSLSLCIAILIFLQSMNVPMLVTYTRVLMASSIKHFSPDDNTRIDRGIPRFV